MENDEKTIRPKKRVLDQLVRRPTKWIKQYEQQIAAGAQQPWIKELLYKSPRNRMYRTGDLGRIRPDGSVECTGRVYSQVKIRDFRIEVGEIDTILSQHPFVRENVAIVRRDKNEEQTPVTYFVPETKRWFEYLEQQEDKKAEDHDLQDESMSGMPRQFKSLSEGCKKSLSPRSPNTLFLPSSFRWLVCP